MARYGQSFYRQRHQRTSLSASVIVDHLLTMIPVPRSVVDVGCGVGSWLRVFEQRGVEEVLGVEGPWISSVPEEELAVPRGKIVIHQLETPLDLGRFDLAVSMEVAEHLPASEAPAFVASLSRLSDLILFSAAIPGQGGVGHQNEQWPEYWAGRFRAHGYSAFDLIRPALWTDDRVSVWYRQNALVYARGESARALPGVASPVHGLVHPELFESLGIRRSARALWEGIRRRLRR